MLCIYCMTSMVFDKNQLLFFCSDFQLVASKLIAFLDSFQVSYTDLASQANGKLDLDKVDWIVEGCLLHA
jgi:hypothetical protein